MDESVKVATTGFAFTGKDGVAYVVRRGQTVRSGHPAFKNHGELLTDLKVDYDHLAGTAKSTTAKSAKPESVDTVLAAVGTDQEKAAAALETEQAQKKPRKSLVEQLHKIVAGPTVEDVLAEVGDDQEKAQAALEQENASEKPRKTLVDALEAIVNSDADQND